MNGDNTRFELLYINSHDQLQFNSASDQSLLWKKFVIGWVNFISVTEQNSSAVEWNRICTLGASLGSDIFKHD